ncbi:membrane protein [Arthrobacter phage Atuin]|nr:membrane protein [Arthrobacter phage Atuin]
MTIQNPLDPNRPKGGKTITTNTVRPQELPAAKIQANIGNPKPKRSENAIAAVVFPFAALFFALVGYFMALPFYFVIAIIMSLASVTAAVLSLRETL